MPGWTFAETHPSHGRTFQRPLDAVELAFYWDGHFNGTEDSLQHVELRLLNPYRDAYLFSNENIVKAWLSTKRRHPLAGATVQILPVCVEGGSAPESTSHPYFVVRERDLVVLCPNEIVFGQVTCADQVQECMASIWDGPRPLSDELLLQLYVFREVNPKRADVLHVMTLTAHCVSDGTANRTFTRCFLDTLARGREESELAQIPLEDRLAMVVPSEDLHPSHMRSLSSARRRWKRSICAIIYQMRLKKSQGGHTLPCRLTRTTPYTPSRPGCVSTVLTEVQTKIVITNCRILGLTFGNAYLALAQVAMTRVLYRRYLRGDMSEEEWEHRKRQPYQGFGPFNLRPHLDKPWFEKGGGGEFMLSINIFPYKLPFMTIGETERCQYCEHDLPDGAPPYSDLLTFDRFLHRAGLVKKQAEAFFGHPLFFEFIHMASLDFAQHTQSCAQRWKEGAIAASGDSDESVLAPTDMSSVLAHGGSSRGNLHLTFPTEYPLAPSHPLSPLSPVPHPGRAGYVSPSPAMEVVDTTPKVVVENTATQLHTRPGELYLGALTFRERLNMYVFYDRNVYEYEVVKEWLDEVRGAVLWYLGQTHFSAHRDQRGHEYAHAQEAADTQKRGC